MNARRLSQPTVFSLRAHEVLELDHVPAGAGIECKEGLLWLTCDNDINDYVIEPGQQVALQPHKRIVIEAMRPARFTMSRN